MRFYRLLFGISLLCCSIVPAIANELDAVVVTVNGVKLSVAELSQEMQKLVPMEASFHGGMSSEKLKSIQAKALDTLVEREMQYQDGLARGMTPDKESVEAEYNRVVERFKGRKEFDKALKSTGFTEKTLRRFISRDVLAEKVRKVEVDDKVRVTDAVVLEYYEKNKSRYMKPEEYRASSILVKVNPAATTEERVKLRARADALLIKIKDGADFGQVAYDNSDDMSRIKGGDMGYFHTGRTVPEFEAAVKKLKVGEVSGIVESMYGFHIIKLTDKKEPRQLPYDEVKDKIRAQLVEKEKKRLFDAWMGDLRSKATIVYPGKG
jgi:parvulin-like peptidyl-prolyl isomerase